MRRHSDQREESQTVFEKGSPSFWPTGGISNAVLKKRLVVIPTNERKPNGCPYADNKKKRRKTSTFVLRRFFFW